MYSGSRGHVELVSGGQCCCLARLKLIPCYDLTRLPSLFTQDVSCCGTHSSHSRTRRLSSTSSCHLHISPPTPSNQRGCIMLARAGLTAGALQGQWCCDVHAIALHDGRVAEVLHPSSSHHRLGPCCHGTRHPGPAPSCTASPPPRNPVINPGSRGDVELIVQGAYCHNATQAVSFPPVAVSLTRAFRLSSYRT
jgi:hypothetical protein